jgi:8-oxo-dGTP diphosphatase
MFLGQYSYQRKRIAFLIRIGMKIRMEARNAAKAFIFHERKLLLIKRRPDDIQTPGIWEGPGGRIEQGENPVEGLKREVKEETGLEIQVVIPFSTKQFTRKDGQIITLIIFLCKSESAEVKLSEEHTEFAWIEIEKAKEVLTDFFHNEIDIIEKFELLKHLE